MANDKDSSETKGGSSFFGGFGKAVKGGLGSLFGLGKEKKPIKPLVDKPEEIKPVEPPHVPKPDRSHDTKPTFEPIDPSPSVEGKKNRDTGEEPEEVSGVGQFMKGRDYADFKSSNVASAKYAKDIGELQLGYKNGGKYRYHDVSPNEAKSFYNAGSKGKWVWDKLRVRGTVFGYRKPYEYMADESQGYIPKYHASETHRQEHHEIDPSGHTPQSWQQGQGPYRPNYGKPTKHAHPFPMGKQKVVGKLTTEEYEKKDKHKDKIPVAKHAPPKQSGPTAAEELASVFAMGEKPAKEKKPFTKPSHAPMKTPEPAKPVPAAEPAKRAGAIGTGAISSVLGGIKAGASKLGSLFGFGAKPKKAESPAKSAHKSNQDRQAKRKGQHKAEGGFVEHMADGGSPDTTQILADDGEMVVKDTEAKKPENAALLEAINSSKSPMLSAGGHSDVPTHQGASSDKSSGGEIRSKLGTPGLDNEPVDVKKDSFVVNANASKEFKPVLEAMNHGHDVAGEHLLDGGFVGMGQHLASGGLASGNHHRGDGSHGVPDVAAPGKTESAGATQNPAVPAQVLPQESISSSEVVSSPVDDAIALWKSLYARIADPSLTYQEIDATINEPFKKLTVPQLKEVGAGVGKTIMPGSKAKIIAQFVRMVKDQKENWERLRPMHKADGGFVGHGQHLSGGGTAGGDNPAQASFVGMGKLPEFNHGDMVDVPRSHTYPALKAIVSHGKSGDVNLTEMGSKHDRPLIRLKDKKQASRFIGDLSGQISGSPTSSNASINNVMQGKAKFLGRGNDGLAFDTGDGNVVKASSEIGFHWNNGIRSEEEGADRIRNQVAITNEMIANGVSGLLPQQLDEHEGRSYATMPKLDTETNLNEGHLESLKNSIKSMHAAGYTIGDDIQPGIAKDGNAYIYDTGAARKLNEKESWRREDIQDDESRLSRLYEKHGFKLKGLNPDTDYHNALDEVNKKLASGKPIAPFWEKNLTRLWNNLDEDTRDFLGDEYQGVLARLAAAPKQNKPTQQHLATGGTAGGKSSGWLGKAFGAIGGMFGLGSHPEAAGTQQIAPGQAVISPQEQAAVQRSSDLPPTSIKQPPMAALMDDAADAEPTVVGGVAPYKWTPPEPSDWGAGLVNLQDNPPAELPIVSQLEKRKWPQSELRSFLRKHQPDGGIKLMPHNEALQNMRVDEERIRREEEARKGFLGRLGFSGGGQVPGVPGVGENEDEVPAKLTKGEEVTRKEQAEKYRPLLKAINADQVPQGEALQRLAGGGGKKGGHGSFVASGAGDGWNHYDKGSEGENGVDDEYGGHRTEEDEYNPAPKKVVNYGAPKPRAKAIPRKLSSVIAGMGGISRSSLETAGYKISELQENGLKHLIHEGRGNAIDQLPSSLHLEGHINVPGVEPGSSTMPSNSVQFLLDQLEAGAHSLHAHKDNEYEKDQYAYLKEQHERERFEAEERGDLAPINQSLKQEDNRGDAWEPEYAPEYSQPGHEHNEIEPSYGPADNQEPLKHINHPSSHEDGRGESDGEYQDSLQYGHEHSETAPVDIPRGMKRNKPAKQPKRSIEPLKPIGQPLKLDEQRSAEMQRLLDEKMQRENNSASSVKQEVKPPVRLPSFNTETGQPIVGEEDRPEGPKEPEELWAKRAPTALMKPFVPQKQNTAPVSVPNHVAAATPVAAPAPQVAEQVAEQPNQLGETPPVRLPAFNTKTGQPIVGKKGRPEGPKESAEGWAKRAPGALAKRGGLVDYVSEMPKRGPDEKLLDRANDAFAKLNADADKFPEHIKGITATFDGLQSAVKRFENAIADTSGTIAEQNVRKKYAESVLNEKLKAANESPVKGIGEVIAASIKDTLPGLLQSGLTGMAYKAGGPLAGIMAHPVAGAFAQHLDAQGEGGKGGIAEMLGSLFRKSKPEASSNEPTTPAAKPMANIVQPLTPVEPEKPVVVEQPKATVTGGWGDGWDDAKNPEEQPAESKAKPEEKKPGIFQRMKGWFAKEEEYKGGATVAGGWGDAWDEETSANEKPTSDYKVGHAPGNFGYETGRTNPTDYEVAPTPNDYESPHVEPGYEVGQAPGLSGYELSRPDYGVGQTPGLAGYELSEVSNNNLSGYGVNPDAGPSHPGYDVGKSPGISGYEIGPAPGDAGYGLSPKDHYEVGHGTNNDSGLAGYEVGHNPGLAGYEVDGSDDGYSIDDNDFAGSGYKVGPVVSNDNEGTPILLNHAESRGKDDKEEPKKPGLFNRFKNWFGDGGKPPTGGGNTTAAGGMGGGEPPGGVPGGAGAAAEGGGGAMAAAGPAAMALGAALALNKAIDAVSGSLLGANDALIGFGTGLARSVGVPKEIADLGGSVANLFSPLRLAADGLKLFQFAAMPLLNLDKPGELLKSTFTAIADVGKAFVAVLWSARDPVQMLTAAVSPFVNQVGKWNPAAIDRMNLAFDNLSAAAGRMFAPIITAVTGFADELNVLYTSLAPEMESLVQAVVTPIRDFAREFAVGFVGVVREGIPVFRGMMEDMKPLGPMVSAGIRLIMDGVSLFVTGAGQAVSFLTPIFTSIMDEVTPAFRVGAEIVRGLFQTFIGIKDAVMLVTEGLRPLFSALVTIGTYTNPVVFAFVTLASQTKNLTAVFAASAGTLADIIRRMRESPTSPIRAIREGFAGFGARFDASLSRMNTPGPTTPGGVPLTGPTTTAAQQARHVGIEDVGLEARRAAYSQGADVASQTAANTAATVRVLQAIERLLQAGNVTAANATNFQNQLLAQQGVMS